MSEAKTVEVVEKPRKSGLVHRVSSHVSEFMTNSSIHGLKYLVGKERTLIEKSLWLAVLSVSIYTCSLLIKSAWQKWEECPVVVGFGQTPVRMWEIPFPAVTICSEYEYNRESNVTVKYLVRKKGWQVGKMSVYCDSEANGIYPHETVFEAADYYEGPEWEEFLVGTALLSEQIFAFCQWGWKYSCADIFFPVITEHGICFSFNMLDKNDLFRDTSYIADALGNQDDISHWTFDKNYDETNDDVYPRRSETISEKLEVGLKSYLEKVACLGFDKFFMMIHHPADTPSMRRAFELETNKSHEILITPQVVVSSENLRSYSPQRKKCYFPEDRYLYFYKIYTVENCKRECLANYTLSKCGCVPYYLPHNKTTKLCGGRNRKGSRCVVQAEEMMLHSESGLRKNRSNVTSCNCLPPCNSVSYDVSFRATETREITVARINFKNTEFIPLEKQELFGDVNFWASCGGLVGLFIGLSVVSCVEIVYHFFFRWVFNLGRRLFQQLSLNRLMFLIMVL